GLDADAGVEDGDRELALRSLLDELPHRLLGAARFREDDGTGNHFGPASGKHGGELALSPGLKQSDRNAFERLRVCHDVSYQFSVVSCQFAVKSSRQSKVEKLKVEGERSKSWFDRSEERRVGKECRLRW